MPLQEQERRTALIHYLARCGAVRLHRERLPLLSADLGVTQRDLLRMIDSLYSSGQVWVNGAEFVLLPPPVRAAA